MHLLQGETPVSWQALAKDGMDLPQEARVTTASEMQMGNGETYDVAFVPSTPGDLRLLVTSDAGVSLATMMIHVTP